MRKERIIDLHALNAKQNLEEPYQVPSNYFANFSQKIKSQIENIPSFDNLEKIKLKGDGDFKVPENYFENFQGRLLSTLKNKKGTIISINKNKIFPLILQVGIAASFGMLFLINLPQEAINKDIKGNDQEIFNAQLSNNVEQLESMQVSDEAIIEEIIKNPIAKKEKKQIYFSDPSIEEMVVTELDLNEIIEQL